MYICEECGKKYEDNDVETLYNPNEHLLDGYPDFFNTRYVAINVNCVCNGKIIKAKECKCCGDWISMDSVYDYCNECLDTYKTIDTMLEIGTDWEEKISLNGFLASAFTKEDIEQILLDCLKNTEKKKVEEAVEKYYNEDIECFRGYADKKWKEEK
jgi:hypothetical protein